MSYPVSESELCFSTAALPHAARNAQTGCCQQGHCLLVVLLAPEDNKVMRACHLRHVILLTNPLEVHDMVYPSRRLASQLTVFCSFLTVVLH